MHELIATQRFLDASLERADATGGGRVRAVRLQVGVLSGLTEESIRFYWELLTPGTAAEGSSLQVTMVAGRVACRTCGTESEVMDDFPICPGCAGVDLVVFDGDACAIEAVETQAAGLAPGADDDCRGVPEVTIAHV